MRWFTLINIIKLSRFTSQFDFFVLHKLYAIYHYLSYRLYSNDNVQKNLTLFANKV